MRTSLFAARLVLIANFRDMKFPSTTPAIHGLVLENAVRSSLIAAQLNAAASGKFVAPRNITSAVHGLTLENAVRSCVIASLRVDDCTMLDRVS